MPCRLFEFAVLSVTVLLLLKDRKRMPQPLSDAVLFVTVLLLEEFSLMP